MFAAACRLLPLLAVGSSLTTVQHRRTTGVVVPLPDGSRVALSTRGPSAFQVRLLPKGAVDHGPTRSPMVEPDGSDAAFMPVLWHSLGENSTCRFNSTDETDNGLGTTRGRTAGSVDECKGLCEQAKGCFGIEWQPEERRCEFWTRPIASSEPREGYQCFVFSKDLSAARGISVTGLGSLSISDDGRLVLRGDGGDILTESEPLVADRPHHDTMVHATHPGGSFLGTRHESGSEQIWSGDTVVLRAHTGRFIEADGEVVRASSHKRDSSQDLVLESAAGPGMLRHGDVVSLHTLAGTVVQAGRQGRVEAQWTATGERQRFVLERKSGDGVVKAGDLVFLRSQERYVHVEGIGVTVGWADRGEWQTLQVEKVRSGSSFLRSGDLVYLQDSVGDLVAPVGYSVEAVGSNYSASHRWLVKKKDGRPGELITSGDTVMLLTSAGMALDIVIDVVKALAPSKDRREWQELTIHRSVGEGLIRHDDQVLFKSHIGPYMDVQTPQQVRAQSYVPVDSMKFRLQLGAPTCAQVTALAGSFNASSTGDIGHIPSDAGDGDVETFWMSGYGSNHEWISIDVGVGRVISRVEVRWGPSFAESYFVQGSADGQTWSTLGMALGTEGWVVTVLPRSAPVRWVRLACTAKPGNNRGFAVYEVVVYGCQETLRLTSNGGNLFGRGASIYDAHRLSAVAVQPQVSDRATYVPYYYSAGDGYAALAVVSHHSDVYERHFYPASYVMQEGGVISWGFHGYLELYLMPARTLADGIGAYMSLTGVPRVPPKYAFGFMASRWGSHDGNYIEDVVTRFRNDSFPIDSIALGAEWFTKESDANLPASGEAGYREFSFSNRTFPDPAKQLSAYEKDLHVRVGGVRKPRLANAAFISMAQQKRWLLPGGTPGGFPLDPDESYAFHRALNFSIPETRKWYARQLQGLIADGVDFWLNDEGETDYFTYHWWNIAERDALESNQTAPFKRFYSMNRAFTPGLARIGGTTWTSNIFSTWKDLRRTPGMMLNWGLAGAPYVGCDIGGFGGEAAPELLVRWMQLGAFMPTMRVHSESNATPRWPWNFGEDRASAMRSALELRYRLAPYHYSLAHAMYTDRKLWMRPLVMEFPEDRVASVLTTQWMDGSIMVAPVLRPDSRRQVYLPNATWHYFNSSRTVPGPAHLGGKAELNDIPAFVRRGTIIVLAPIVQSTDELPGGPLEVQIYTGRDCSFELVEDDGESVAYESGSVRATTFRWYESAGTLSWRARGSFNGADKKAFKELMVTVFDAQRTQPVHMNVTKLLDGGSLMLPKAAHPAQERDLHV